MAEKTILVTGANGQLGNEMQVIARSWPNDRFLFVTREQLPINNAAAVQQFFKDNSVDVCVNCAAYTAVDKAETETDAAFEINGTAVGTLAALCKEKGARFIHISTDYVFDGTATEPYLEDHPVSPVNAYGASKLKGEELALHYNPDSIIIRTSWVYSSFGNNFVKTMLRLMKDRDSLNVVADQQGCPTYAADLAAAIMQIISKDRAQAGIYHYSNEGIINWYEFAIAIRDIAGLNCQVNPIPSSQYPTPAKRPAYSVMRTNKIQEAFQVTIPQWKDSLATCIALLQA